MLLIQNELTKVFENNNSKTRQYLELAERKTIKYYNGLYLDFFNQFYVRTNCKIDHFFDINFGDSITQVKHKLRVIYLVIPFGNDIDVLSYKIGIGKYKIEVELHFFHQKLVFFKYAFPYIKNKSEIIHYLNKKYFKDFSTIDFSYEGVVDFNDNFLKVCEEDVFKVLYLSRKFGFFNYLKKIKNSSKNDPFFVKNILTHNYKKTSL